ncbi:MAG TPA: hypothetical protein VH637_06025 [Streptosporangiaceae bacterium]|jgi:hypothetical protein
MRKSVVLALSAGALAGSVLAPAAASASTGGLATAGTLGSAAVASHAAAKAAAAVSDPDTTVTFAVTSGELTITAPVAASLGSSAPGETLSGVLGTVTVSDNRALLSASWTATAASTSFTTGAGTPAETIPASDATYTPGTVHTTGVITATPTQITLSNSPQTVVAGANGTGNNSASWDPTVAISIPAAAVFGTYAGTIAHSVS